MPYSRKLIDYVPPYYDELVESSELLAAEDAEFARLNASIDETLRQFTVATATWGLREWERICGITPKPGSTHEERRSRILAKLRGAAPATLANMLAVINAHVPQKNAKLVELPEPGVINLEIPLQSGINFNELSSDLNTYKPAHLQFVITMVARLAELRINVKTYDFDVLYPITNTFTTAALPGVMTKIGANIQLNDYTFEATYRITNEFTTGDYEGRVSIAAASTMVFNAYDAPFIRSGDYELGGGLRLGGYVDDEETILDRIMMQTNVSTIDVEGNDLGGLEISAETENSDVIYKRTNDIYLGEGDL